MSETTAKKTVLVVEDDDVFRELLTWALNSAGYETMGAENGKSALPLIEEGKPDVILLDLLMPVMDGLRLLHWLKEEAKLSIPTLVLTGLENRSFAVDALVAGASDVMVKPVELPTLLDKLAKLA